MSSVLKSSVLKWCHTMCHTYEDYMSSTLTRAFIQHEVSEIYLFVVGSCSSSISFTANNTSNCEYAIIFFLFFVDELWLLFSLFFFFSCNEKCTHP